MNLLKVFVDSDVVISSLLSSKGAAYCFIHQKPPQVKLFLSNFSIKEQEVVVRRLKLASRKLQRLIQKHFTVVELKSLVKIKREYQQYTLDPNDAHIVAGAHQVRAQFLITYNRRHFKEDLIKKDLDIILLTPAQFLQYLRSKI